MAASTTANGVEIILFDLPSQHKGADNLSCFSFNPWKTRLILNYKALPYRTQWTEYPELASTLTTLGVPPNAPGTAFMPYSSPTIRLPHQGEVIMHSAAIASRLETLYPTPSLHLDTGLQAEAEKVVEVAAAVIWWDALVTTQDVCLSARSREYFARTRREVFGATLEELREAKGGEGAWREAEKGGGVLEGVRELLTKYRRDEGPFALGKQVSYADFVVVALFECMKRCDPPGFERLMAFDKSFKELHEACEEWLKRDD